MRDSDRNINPWAARNYLAFNRIRVEDQVSFRRLVRYHLLKIVTVMLVKDLTPKGQSSELSFKSVEQRFYMEEDTKGRGRENFPLSFNIIAAQEI